MILHRKVSPRSILFDIFINDLDDETDSIFIKYANCTKLEEFANTLDDGLELKWSSQTVDMIQKTRTKFNKYMCKV